MFQFSLFLPELHSNALYNRDQKRVRVLENYCGLATRNKAAVDRAMQSFIEMLDQDQDYLPAVLGMATGFMIEKNQVFLLLRLLLHDL